MLLGAWGLLDGPFLSQLFYVVKRAFRESKVAIGS